MRSATAGEDAGMPGPGSGWIKSSRSFSNGNCVEMRHLPEGQIGVRDSKNPAGAILRFDPAEWRAFLAGVRHGEFDGPDQL